MQEYVRTPQPDFVMPPQPARPGADNQIVTPSTAVPASPYALTSHCHDEIRQAHSRPQFPAIRPHSTHVSATTQLQPLYKFDTCQIRTAFLQLREVSSAPICVSTPTRPTSPSPATTKSAKHVSPPGIHPMQLICQLRPRYDHETNETPPRYEKNRYSYEERLTPLSGRRTVSRPNASLQPRQSLRNTITLSTSLVI